MTASPAADAGTVALAALAAALLLCVAHGYAPVVAPVAPVPLLWLLRRTNRRQAFYAGLLCGAGEAAILAGLAHADATLPLAMAALFALARALFARVHQACGRGHGPLGAAAAAALWALVERLQAALPGALPTLLGDTQHVGPLGSIARLGGTYSVSFVLVWIAAAAARVLDAITRPRVAALPAAAPRGRVARALRARCVPATAHGRAARGLVLPLTLTASLVGLAAWTAPVPRGSTTVALVQGGLPTWAYVRADVDPQWAQLPLRTYLGLSAAAPAAALTIWPETAIWRTWGADPPYAAALTTAAAARGDLLVGTPRRDADGRLRNSAVLLRRGGARPATAVAIVDKERLAPRVESLFYAEPISPAAAVLPTAAAPVGVIFCLESAVPEYARRRVAAGAELLVVLAEGGRFGGSPVGRLHAQRSALRAIESGRSVVHAGQQGYSGAFAADGRPVAPPLPAFRAAATRVTVPLYAGTRTPWVRLGDLVLLPLGGLCATAWWRARARHASAR